MITPLKVFHEYDPKFCQAVHYTWKVYRGGQENGSFSVRRELSLDTCKFRSGISLNCYTMAHFCQQVLMLFFDINPKQLQV